jgi:hypothetical protein
MLAHATNNALSYLIQRNEQTVQNIAWLNAETTEWLPWYLVVAALIALVAGLWWLKRIGDRATGAPVVVPISVEAGGE